MVEVKLDDEQIYSKKALGRFPDPGEVENLLRGKIAYLFQRFTEEREAALPTDSEREIQLGSELLDQLRELGYVTDQ